MKEVNSFIRPFFNMVVVGGRESLYHKDGIRKKIRTQFANKLEGDWIKTKGKEGGRLGIWKYLVISSAQIVTLTNRKTFIYIAAGFKKK